MKFCYYYGLVLDLMAFSGMCDDFTFHVDENFNDPRSNFTNWGDCASCHMSMDCEYYDI